MIPALLATFLFCLSAVSATRATRHLGGTAANFWRLLLATFLLAIYAHGFSDGIRGNGFSMFFWSGVVGFGIGDLALYQALPRLGSRMTLLLVHCVAAPSAAFAEFLWLQTTLSLPQMGATGCILLGVVVALAPNRNASASTGLSVPGIAFGVVAALGQGMGAVMSRVAEELNRQGGLGVDGLTAAYQRILGGIVVAGAAFWMMQRAGKRRSPMPDPATPVSKPSKSIFASPWPWIIGTALAGPTLGVGCYQWALSGTPSGLVLPVVATTPLMVIPLSAWLEGDRPNTRSVVGGLIAVLGVILLGKFS